MELLIPLAQAAEGITDTGITDAGKAIALGVGAGLGSIGAGIGIGVIFGSEIQAVAFYTFIFGLIAFFL
ncbi:MAG: ATP synthase F0 subunit C [Solirubrobacterales bacterium]